MKYMVTTSYIDVIGLIWMPAVQCSMRYTLTDYDIDICKDDEGKVTRESVDLWLSTHSGDFQGIDDWTASLEVDGETVDFEWKDEESECTYIDTMGEEY